MDKLIKDNEILRDALILLVGAETRDELIELEKALISMPIGSDLIESKLASLNAIRALLQTMPEGT